MLTPPQRLPPLRNNKALGKWLNDLRDFAAALLPLPSFNVDVRHTALGVSYEGKAGSAPAPSSGMVYLGEWSPAVSYVEQNVVRVSGGVAAGCYVCIRDAPAGTPAPGFPAIGNYWDSLSIGAVLGSWG